MQIANPCKKPACVKYDRDLRLLKDISGFELLKMLDNALPVMIEIDEGEKLNFSSGISILNKDKKLSSSYLITIQEDALTKIYCQLPVIKNIAHNPASRKLLYNRLDVANKNKKDHAIELHEDDNKKNE